MTARRHPAPSRAGSRLAAVRTARAALFGVRPVPTRQAAPAGGEPHPVRAETTRFGGTQATAARVGHPAIVTPSGGEQA
jgi:hypothetical protein